MTTECAILVGIFDGFSWIRAEGKGSFLNSPILKAFADERITAGERCLVVDLADCAGMDSTFMGTLAGVAARLSAQDGGQLQVADSGLKNRNSLEDLGLDFLMDIDPPEAIWRGQIDAIRSKLSPQTLVRSGKIQQAEHVLEAHQTLADANDQNSSTFSSVIATLESQLAEKQRLADEQKKR